MDIQMALFFNVFVNSALIAQLLSDKKKDVSIRDSPRFRTTCMKARKETPHVERSTVCFHAIIQKVLISENHKAQTLSAEADSYVKKKALFFVNC